MTYRFIDPDGREISIDGESELRIAIQEGRLQPDSLMFQADTGKWAPAAGHPAYQRTLRPRQESQPEAASPHETSSPDDDLPDERSAAADPPPRDDPPNHFRTWQRIALAGVIVIGFMMMGDTMHPAERIGAVVGVFLGTGLFAGLFLVWSRRSRPYIPFVMLAIALLSLIGNMVGPDRPSGTSQQLDELEAIVDRMEDEVSVSGEFPGTRQPPAASPPPSGGSLNQRAVWASQRIVETIEQVMLEYEEKHQMGYEHIEGWLAPHYFANASQYPHVPDYFRRNRAFVQDMRENLESDVIERMDEVMDQADLPDRARQGFERSFLEGLRENSMESSGMADLQWGFGATAEELHQLLVANEHLIQLNPNTGVAEIRDVDVEDQAFDLLDDLDWYTIQIATNQEDIIRNVRGTLEEARAVLR